MNAGEDIKVRAYAPGDRDTVRRISRDTAFAGLAPHGMGKEEWLADALTLYFTDFEPHCSFVAVRGEEVLGYVTGAVDGRRMRRVTRRHIVPRLIGRFITSGFLFDASRRHFVGEGLRCWVKGEFRRPGFRRAYPAELHINLDAGARRRGAGRKLITAFTEYARAQGVIGVQVSVLSDPARDFFKAQGFAVLYQTERTFLQKTRDEKSPWYIMGKKLTAE